MIWVAIEGGISWLASYVADILLSTDSASVPSLDGDNLAVVVVQNLRLPEVVNAGRNNTQEVEGRGRTGWLEITGAPTLARSSVGHPGSDCMVGDKAEDGKGELGEGEECAHGHCLQSRQPRWRP
ncbi:hypothetical protein GUJ93_ZPchr0004g38195 [Zizania palustris]|uniref:Uncharacterized protein n=1 Tax=Zizania palustris TaxID=103762 RepID=A0A8J5SYC6_ZIZPA|nr:hypothetical protein GUJ93_ZPchr0004g38195 [Zizania palustris]